MASSLKRDSVRFSLLLLITVFLTRMVGVVITYFVGFNPWQADATTFARHAELTAELLIAGEMSLYQLVTAGLSSGTNERMGVFLVPFWLLPGPSILYAATTSALLGSIAVLNVYFIARKYHSHRAGIYAVLPLIFYPSFIFVHGTVLREATILFALTTAARLYITPPRRIGRITQIALIAILIIFAGNLRRFIVPIVLVSVIVGGLVYAVRSSKRTTEVVTAVATLVVLTPILISHTLGRSIQNWVEFLASRRQEIAYGRTVYLPDVVIQTPFDAIAFSWIAAAYFVFAPFPWMITTFADLVVGVESVINIVFVLASIFGLRTIDGQYTPSTAVLVVFFLSGVVLFGLGMTNYGTAIRLRQMFIWIAFLIGGIGIACRIRYCYTDRHSIGES